MSLNLGDLLTTDEAADMLGIHRASLYTYMHRAEGFPEPVRVGRTVLFHRQALLEWRAAHPSRRKRASPPA